MGRSTVAIENVAVAARLTRERWKKKKGFINSFHLYAFARSLVLSLSPSAIKRTLPNTTEGSPALHTSASSFRSASTCESATARSSSERESPRGRAASSRSFSSRSSSCSLMVVSESLGL